MASDVKALKCRWHSAKETARPGPPHGGASVPDKAKENHRGEIHSRLGNARGPAEAGAWVPAFPLTEAEGMKLPFLF